MRVAGVHVADGITAVAGQDDRNRGTGVVVVDGSVIVAIGAAAVIVTGIFDYGIQNHVPAIAHHRSIVERRDRDGDCFSGRAVRGIGPVSCSVQVVGCSLVTGGVAGLVPGPEVEAGRVGVFLVGDEPDLVLGPQQKRGGRRDRREILPG